MSHRFGSRNWENDMRNIRREVGMRGSLATAWIMGVMLILFAVLIVTNSVNAIGQWMITVTPDWLLKLI